MCAEGDRGVWIEQTLWEPGHGTPTCPAFAQMWRTPPGTLLRSLLSCCSWSLLFGFKVFSEATEN